MLKCRLQQFIEAEITQPFGPCCWWELRSKHSKRVAAKHSLRMAAERMKPLPSTVHDLHSPSSENCGLTHSSIICCSFFFFSIFLSFFVCLPINLSKFRAMFKSNAEFECRPGQMGSWWRSPREITFQRIEVDVWFTPAALINHWSFALSSNKQSS